MNRKSKREGDREIGRGKGGTDRRRETVREREGAREGKRKRER